MRFIILKIDISKYQLVFFF